MVNTFPASPVTTTISSEFCPLFLSCFIVALTSRVTDFSKVTLSAFVGSAPPTQFPMVDHFPSPEALLNVASAKDVKDTNSRDSIM